jgi:hypothetical protein
MHCCADPNALPVPHSCTYTPPHTVTDAGPDFSAHSNPDFIADALTDAVTYVLSHPCPEPRTDVVAYTIADAIANTCTHHVSHASAYCISNSSVYPRLLPCEFYCMHHLCSWQVQSTVQRSALQLLQCRAVCCGGLHFVLGLPARQILRAARPNLHRLHTWPVPEMVGSDELLPLPLWQVSGQSKVFTLPSVPWWALDQRHNGQNRVLSDPYTCTHTRTNDYSNSVSNTIAHSLTNSVPDTITNIVTNTIANINADPITNSVTQPVTNSITYAGPNCISHICSDREAHSIANPGSNLVPDSRAYPVAHLCAHILADPVADPVTDFCSNGDADSGVPTRCLSQACTLRVPRQPLLAQSMHAQWLTVRAVWTGF